MHVDCLGWDPSIVLSLLQFLLRICLCLSPRLYTEKKTEGENFASHSAHSLKFSGYICLAIGKHDARINSINFSHLLLAFLRLAGIKTIDYALILVSGFMFANIFFFCLFVYLWLLCSSNSSSCCDICILESAPHGVCVMRN